MKLCHNKFLLPLLYIKNTRTHIELMEVNLESLLSWPDIETAELQPTIDHHRHTAYLSFIRFMLHSLPWINLKDW